MFKFNYKIGIRRDNRSIISKRFIKDIRQLMMVGEKYEEEQDWIKF